MASKTLCPLPCHLDCTNGVAKQLGVAINAMNSLPMHLKTLAENIRSTSVKMNYISSPEKSNLASVNNDLTIVSP